MQVTLDDDDLERLERFARTHGWTKSQAVHAAIRALTRQPSDDPLLELSGDIDGLPVNLSENFDAYMSETFVAEPRSTVSTRARASPCVMRREKITSWHVSGSSVSRRLLLPIPMRSVLQ